MWIPDITREFLGDCLEIWRNGHRLTPTGKKRWIPRHATWRWNLHYPQHVIENPEWRRGIAATPVRQILQFDRQQDLLFVNVDNHWGIERFRREVMALCDQWGLEYLCLSFDALRVAGMRMDARFLPIYRERICDFDLDRLYGRRWRHTFPESTFRYTFRGHTKRFISGWDSNDRVPRYFLAELPKGAVATSMEAARESLMPPAVHKALLEGRKVKRQGDVFAIKTDIKERDLKKQMLTRAAARHWQQGWIWHMQQTIPHWVPEDTRSRHWREQIATQDNIRNYAQRLSLHGTAHTATEVLHTHDGAVYGKGSMIHLPAILGQNRVPDHQHVRLDDGRDGWWLFVRNTVPQRDGTVVPF